MIRFSNYEDKTYLNKLLSNSELAYDNNPFCKCIVYDDKSIKGLIYFEEIYERVDIDYIFVSNNYRRQGIGSKLLKYLIDYCKKKKNQSL